jgi:hypothetical protein
MPLIVINSDHWSQIVVTTVVYDETISMYELILEQT